jgi:Zn-dependent protease with chaperone function
MNNASQTSPRSPRINPFAFPTDTDLRFVLLIFSVLSSTLFVYNLLSADFLGAQINIALQCTRSVPTSLSGDLTSLVIIQQQNLNTACQSSYRYLLLGWFIGGIALVLLVAFIIYLLTPIWVLRREKLVPISVEDAPEVVAYLKSLCQEAGLSEFPLFVWNPLNQVSNGLGFGSLRRYYVMLTGGLVTLFYTDQPVFRAIILHELSHLRNADVNKTYFTIAIWWAFVLVALVPLAVYLLIRLPFTPLLTANLIWRVLVLAVFVYLTRNALLRAREFYADLRASTWPDVAKALNRVLATRGQAGKLGQAHPSWQKLISVHPTSDERSLVLYDTRRLFRAGWWTAFGVGFAAGIALLPLQTLFSLFLDQSQIDFRVTVMPSLLVTVLLLTPFIVGTVGLDTWRTVFLASLQGQAPQGAGRLGLCLGMGIVSGIFLSLPSFLEGSSLALLVDLFIYNLPWILLLLASLFLFFRWIASGATVWLLVAATRQILHLIYIIGLLITGVVFIGWSSQILQFSFITTLVIRVDKTDIGSKLGYLFIETLHEPLTFLTLIGLWSFPLALWFWRNRLIALPSRNWAFLDVISQSQQIPSPNSHSLRPGLPMKFGLSIGLTFFLILLLGRVFLRLSGLADTINNDINLIDVFYYSQIALTLLLQALGAAIVTAMTRELRSLHGLMTASIAGCIMVFSILALNVLFGGTADAEIIWLTTSLVLNGGALVALLIALGTSMLLSRH